ENSKGIETSFNNIKNAIAKGVANSIKALDDLSKAATGKSIADHFDSLKVVINASFSAINASIKASTPLFKLLFSVIGAGISVVKALSPALVGVASGLAAMRTVNETITMIKALNRAWVMASASMSIGATTIKTVTAVQAVSTTMTKADMVARLSQLGVLKASTVIYGVMTGAISLSTAATIASTAAVTALKAALVALTGPVGWVVGAIGALVAVGVSLWSWLTKESDETKKLKKEQEGLVE
ncbi:tape measure protein, partial [Streptococcus pyogenes]